MPNLKQESRIQQISKRVTLLDVANASGFSRATVSLVLRDSPLVAEETRQRVQAVMRDLGYVYHRAAANLRSHKSHTVGLVVSDITNPFFAEMTMSIEAQLDKANYISLLCNTSEMLGKQERLLSTLQEYSADGILLCPARGTTLATIEKLQRFRLPFVLVGRHLPGIQTDYVGADNILGAGVAVENYSAATACYSRILWLSPSQRRLNRYIVRITGDCCRELTESVFFCTHRNMIKLITPSRHVFHVSDHHRLMKPHLQRGCSHSG
jgi:DNA-binding LacI/PurR family transcriptional regulator